MVGTAIVGSDRFEKGFAISSGQIYRRQLHGQTRPGVPTLSSTVQ
jgi:hypothetical protein